MRLGSVIGRVTLSVTVPPLEGGLWLIVSPFTREQYSRAGVSPASDLLDPAGRGRDACPTLSAEPSLIVYDDLGAALGQTIGFIEGREAACPFDKPAPVDAINAALVDEIFYSP